MKKLYVGNLPFSVGDVELRDLFAPFGSVRSAMVVNNRETGRSRGFGFVEMDNDNEASEAIEKMNGADCDGRNLAVNEARPREPRSAGGRGGGGGW